MSEFVKPKRVFVSDEEYVKSLVKVNLQKDLHDNEELCPVCHGTGMIVENNPYGLSDDPDRKVGMFPYKHQFLTFCPHCYNGVVHRCKLCGEIMPRGMLKHNCKKQKELDYQEVQRREEALLENAQLVPDDEVEMYYCNGIEFFEDWDEFFSCWSENALPGERPEYVWATKPVYMKMDADNIIERATEELYEDAYMDVSDKETKELQDILDKWCDSCGVGVTYEIDKTRKVRIPWDDVIL